MTGPDGGRGCSDLRPGLELGAYSWSTVHVVARLVAAVLAIAASGLVAVAGRVAQGPSAPSASAPTFELVEFDVPAGSHPHDVAPAPDGGVWYTGQGNGTLGCSIPPPET